VVTVADIDELGNSSHTCKTRTGLAPMVPQRTNGVMREEQCCILCTTNERLG
jgi:hypothetical protein